MLKKLLRGPQKIRTDFALGPKRLARLLGAGLLLAALGAQAQTSNALSGAYTINSASPTAGTNFASFSDAATRLNTDGVSGPVTITVTGGPYSEQFLLGQVAGTSATNTLVVNGGGSTLQFASTTSTQRAVVQLNGTDFTTINNLVIDATGGTYGYGVLLTNGADNDFITNNTINADIATTSTNFAGITASGSVSSAVSSGNSANSLTIQGNTVNGGYYGIVLYGSSSAATTANVVSNNTVRDFYSYGIYAVYQSRGQILGNDISRPLRTNPSTCYGLYSSTGTSGMAIERNRLHNLFDGNPTSTNSTYALYLGSGSTPTATAPNEVINNVLYNLGGNGLQYGIYGASAAYSRIYHNSISSDDQSATTSSATYGIYSSGANSEVQNNVVSITRTGTGTKYGLYYATNAPASNYNDVYVPNGNVGYYSGAFTTLANWQRANNGAFDQNSVSADPLFVSAGTGNLQPSNGLLNNVGTPLARVTTDITGAPRSTTPDPGAYEFTSVAIDVLPLSLAGPATGSGCYGTAEPLIVQVRNGGTAPLNFATTGATVTVVVTPPSGPAQTFTGTVSTGTLASYATQNITLPGTLNMSALGTYSFAITATVAGDANPSNDVLTPAATRTVVAPVAGTLSPAASALCISGTATLALAGSANGDVQYQRSTSATGPFTDVAGATAAAYTTPVLTSTTYYRVRTTCTTNIVYSNVTTITVNNPQVASTNTPLTVCAGSAATLTATAGTGAGIRFYSAATGGVALATTTAGSYTTPALTAATTYYAEAYSGSTEQVGPTSNNLNAGSGTNFTYAMVFNAAAPTVLTGVYVYPTTTGVSNIQLLSSSGAVLQTYQATFTAADLNAKTFVTLNFNVPAGTGLRLGLNATGSTADLYRNTAGATYPYTSPSGQISITGNTFTSGAAYYYYFYDWVVSTECPSTTRTPIVVNVTPAPATPTLTAAAQPNGSVLLTAAPVAGATYQFYRNNVAVGTPGTANTLLLQSGTLNGSYTVAVLSGGCASAQSAAVAVTITGTRTSTLSGVSLLVYPNPTPDGQLTVELTGAQAKASDLTVVNSLGQVVRAVRLAPGAMALRLAELAPGVYTLRVQTPDGLLTQRVVRE